MTREFWRDRSVLVTGHTGFKGAWLTAWLSFLGAELHGFSAAPNTQPSLFELATRDLGTTTLGDINNPAAVEDAVSRAKPEIILHLAAQALVRRSYAEPIETFATNVLGTVHLLDAIRRAPSVRAVIVVTSDKCYENEESGRAYNERDRLGGRDPYSSSKACCELATAAYRESFFRGSTCAIATARAGNVIGGGDWSDDRLVPDIVRARDGGSPIAIRSPDAVRPWQHVLDALWGYLVLAEALAGPQGGSYAQAWNFGPHSSDAVPVRFVVERLAWRWDLDWEIGTGLQLHEAHLLSVDSRKAREQLGWRPRLNPMEAVDWTADWYSEVQDGADPLSVTKRQIEAFEARPF